MQILPPNYLWNLFPPPQSHCHILVESSSFLTFWRQVLMDTVRHGPDSLSMKAKWPQLWEHCWCPALSYPPRPQELLSLQKAISSKAHLSQPNPGQLQGAMLAPELPAGSAEAAAGLASQNDIFPGFPLPSTGSSSMNSLMPEPYLWCSENCSGSWPPST